MISPPSSPVILPLPHTRLFYSPPPLRLASSLFLPLLSQVQNSLSVPMQDARLASRSCLFLNDFSFSYTSFCPRTQHREAINTHANVTQTHTCLFFSTKWFSDILYSGTHTHAYSASSGILKQHKVLSFCLGFEETFLKFIMFYIIQTLLNDIMI